MNKAFGLACLVAATTAHKFQTFARDHHKRMPQDDPPDPQPENNIWDAYWADNINNSLTSKSQFAGCMGCSLAMDGVRALL